MIALRRAVIVCEWILIICEWILISVFVLVSIVLLLELLSAWNAQACSVKITHDCYPWGMTEGPMEGASWSYASKQNYLVSGFYLLGVALLAPISMLWLRPGRRILGLLVAIVLLYAGERIMPLVF